MTSSEPVLIRNFNLMKNIFDNLDVLTTHYKLKKRDINIVHLLLTRHTTFNAYIQVKTTDFSDSRKTIYRGLTHLENENIIIVAERPTNQYGSMKIYFTEAFIKRVCGEEFGGLYKQWLEWQLNYKEENS